MPSNEQNLLKHGLKKHSLSGCNVLITRPAERGENLTRLVNDAGGKAINFPIIDILFPEEDGEFSYDAVDSVLINSDQYDLFIFVSVPSVQSVGGRLKDQQFKGKKWSVNPPRIAVVGSKTAKVSQEHDFVVDFCPMEKEKMNSEGLLERLSAINIKGKRIAIFRGQDGRNRLGSALLNQGAWVEYVECYRRKTSTACFENIRTEWNNTGFDFVVITSASILHGLMERLGKEDIDMLNQTTILTVGDRLEKICRDCGFQNLAVAKNPGDEELLKSLLEQRSVK